MVYIFSCTRPCNFWLCIALKQNVPYTIKQLITYTHIHIHTHTYTIKLQIQWQHVKNKLKYKKQIVINVKKNQAKFQHVMKVIVRRKKFVGMRRENPDRDRKHTCRSARYICLYI